MATDTHDVPGRRPLYADVPPGDLSPERHALLVVAARAFATRGYTGTTLDDVATEAGIDPERARRLAGSKAELLYAAGLHVVMTPHGSLEERVAGLGLEQVGVDERLDRFVGLACELHPRLAPLVPAINESAVVDPEALSMRQGSDLLRIALSRRLAALFCRGGEPEPDAAELVHVQMMTEQYSSFLRSGWTPERYGVWLRGALDRAVNGDRAGT